MANKRKQCVIYALTDDGTLDTVHYVGQTTNFDRIVSLHIGRKRNGSPRDKWIELLLASGKRPIAIALSTVIGDASIIAYHVESQHIHQWVHYTKGGLLNVASRQGWQQTEKLLAAEHKADRNEFEEKARWAIRKCIQLGLMEMPSTYRGWGRLLVPKTKRKRRIKDNLKKATRALQKIQSRYCKS
jgi:hypothetical protein